MEKRAYAPGAGGHEEGLESWRLLARELDVLLDLESPQERSRRIAAAGEHDPDLPRRLEAALAAAEDDDFLAAPAAEFHPGLLFFGDTLLDEDAWIGRRVGRWRLVESLGRGGMGVVFRAERADGTFEQTAALKLLAADRPGFEELFVAERQSLARLEHPHIARLIDGGAGDDGTPFLVTELVDGQPIDQWADDHDLGVEERLRLFLDVCDAVEHAHRKMLVHRDLKPGNVLVAGDGTQGGTVKLLDFGVARLMEDGRDDGPAPLTVAYAAPEQIAGEPVSAATDVYALGCLLTRLLAGRSPRAGAELDHDGERLVRRGDEAPPSASTVAAEEGADPRLQRRLRGDLDAIVAKTLAIDPERRYASVRELADDVERHLAHAPVRARDGGRLYRAGRALRRHWIAAAAVVLAVVAAAFGGLMLQQRAQEAEAQAERAERVVEFVEEVLRPEILAAEAVEPADVLAAGVRTARQRFAEQPEVEAAVLESLGSMLNGLDAHDHARQALERAVELRRAGDDAEALVKALSYLSWTEGQAGAKEVGLAHRDAAVRLARDRAGERSVAHAAALHARGFYVLRILGRDPPRSPTVAEDLEKALDLYRRLLPPDHPRIASATFDLGLATADPAESIPRLVEGIELMRRSPDVDPESLAFALGDLALVYENAGDADNAVATARRAVEAMDRVKSPRNPDRLTLLNNLAAVLRDAGRFGEALPLYEEVLAGRRHLMPDDAGWIAFPLYGLGRVHLGMGEPRQAEIYLREALELAEREGWTARKEAILHALSESLKRQERRDDSGEPAP